MYKTDREIPRNLQDREVNRLGGHLENKKIALCVTGSIAAYKAPSIVRHFRQYGADVHVYLTQEGERYIGKDSLEWTSTNPVICELTASAEHLYEYDAYIVAPATLNTIGQMADGKASNAVTTTLASALGRLKRGEASILIAPAMHGTLEDNPAYQQNLRKLQSYGIKVIQPKYMYGKANLPSSHNIVVQTIRQLSRSPIRNRRILVTAGPTPGRIDNVRFLTNRFRGRLGIRIADEAYMRGAEVKLILGPSGINAPAYIDTTLIKDFNEYYSKVMEVLEHFRFDFGIFCASVADYIPKKAFSGKIPSQGGLDSIKLKQTPKVIREVREKFPEILVVMFKYEEKLSKGQLEKIATSRVKEGYHIVVANRGEDMTPDGEYRCIIVNKKGVVAEPKSRNECANLLLNLLEKSEK
ncbi:MAG: bifunctional phosphopantothenoylcysteine decarboxylase/phosphopantothenate--cysteine ligase CoaBC [Candidatus Bathyarchaeota archaeon]|nr:MAG: bifunctional phosphopantothenoylcysteine decarboxylase/phosphopantothenate--cysteine ligase CoaBC [Candidatus Bathyarchaeota archaeon]